MLINPIDEAAVKEKREVPAKAIETKRNATTIILAITL